MIVEHELTATELNDAYSRGQRKFERMELVSQGEYASLRDSDLTGAQFTDCWFHSATFLNVNFRGAKFTRCNLKCTTFEGCNLSESEWRDCRVCAIAIGLSDSAGTSVDRLDAYGSEFESVRSFLEYATGNFDRRHDEPRSGV